MSNKTWQSKKYNMGVWVFQILITEKCSGFFNKSFSMFACERNPKVEEAESEVRGLGKEILTFFIFFLLLKLL